MDIENIFDNVSLEKELKNPQIHFSVSTETARNVSEIRSVNHATSKRLQESIEKLINEVIYPSFKKALDEGKLKVKK